MKRSSYIDVLRGLAILFVIFGHAGQRNVDLIPKNTWSAAVFSFGHWHMALFMVISGWLTFGRVPSDVAPWLVRKARMLLIPYSVWTLVYYWIPDPLILKFDNFWTYAKMAVLSPANTFWYFYVLFLCYMTMAAVSKLGTWSIFPIGVALAVLPFDVFGLDLLGWYWWWFSLGYLSARFGNQLVRVRGLGWAATAIAYPVLLFFTPGDSSLWVKVVWGLAGLGLSTAVAALLMGTAARRPFAHLGRHTFELYPSEFIFFLIPLPLSLLRIPAYTAMAVVGGLGLAAVLRQSPLTAALFLGDRRSKAVRKADPVMDEGT